MNIWQLCLSVIKMNLKKNNPLVSLCSVDEEKKGEKFEFSDHLNDLSGHALCFLVYFTS